MKRMTIVMMLLASSCLVRVQTVEAQAQASATAADNQATIDQDVSLPLTDAEATKFWPIYEQYAAELTQLGDQKYALIKEYAQGYGTLSNEQALSLLNRSLALDQQIAQLRTKYVPIVNKVLPGIKTATFFQLDRRLTSLVDLQLASEIPLAQDQK